MSVISKSPRVLLLLAMVAGPASAGLAAQPQDAPDADLTVTVSDTSSPNRAEMTEGPEIEGFISARSGDRMQVTAADGTNTVVSLNGDLSGRHRIRRADEVTFVDASQRGGNSAMPWRCGDCLGN